MTIGTPKGQPIFPWTSYTTSLFKPKGFISDKNTKDKWHTKRHTNSFIQDQGKIKMSSVIDTINNWYTRWEKFNGYVKIYICLTPKAKVNTSYIDQIITINSKARCISSIDTNDN